MLRPLLCVFRGASNFCWYELHYSRYKAVGLLEERGKRRLCQEHQHILEECELMLTVEERFHNDYCTFLASLASSCRIFGTEMAGSRHQFMNVALGVKWCCPSCCSHMLYVFEVLIFLFLAGHGDTSRSLTSSAQSGTYPVCH